MQPVRPAEGPSRQAPLGRVPAETLNVQAAELARLGKVAGEELTVSQSATGVQISAPPPPPAFWAEIRSEGAGPNAGRYGWIEKEPLAGGGWKDKQGGAGRSGTPSENSAYEVNGNQGIPVGTIVWLERGAGAAIPPVDGIGVTPGRVDQDWLFEHCC